MEKVEKQIDFKSLFESAPGLFLLLLPDLTIVAVSDAYAAATLTKREEITGRHLFDVFPVNPDPALEDAVSNITAAMHFVVKNKASHAMPVQRYDIRRPDGTFEEKYWSAVNKPVLNASNEVAYIIHRVEDVTPLVQLQKDHIKKGEVTNDLQNQLLEMASALVIANKELAFQNLQKEKRASELDVANQELTFQNQEKENRASELAFANKELLFQNIEKEKRASELFTVNKALLKSDGIIKQFNQELEQKVAERTSTLENLHKDIADYKYALDAADIVAVTDQKGIIQYANENFCKISKYTKEELIGRDHRIVNSGYHSKEFIRDLWVTIANGKIWKGEIKNKAKDGSVYWVYTTIIPFLDELDKPYKYLAIRSDITEQKRATSELQLNEIKYRNLFENSLAAICTLDMSTQKPVDVNATGARLFGYQSKAHFIKDFNLQTHFADPQDVESIARTIIEKGEIINREARLKKLDGTEFWGIASAKMNFETSIAQSVMIDITERKLSIEKLKVSEEKYRSFFENSVVAMFTVDMHSLSIIDVNEMGVRLFGYPSKQDLLNDYNPKLHFEQIENRVNNIQTLREKGEINNLEQEFKRLDGSRFWAKLFVKLNADKSLAHSVIIDTSQQKKAIVQLAASEEKYRNLFQNSLVSMHITDMLNFKAADVNDMAVEVFGYQSKADFLANYASVKHFVKPDDWEKILRALSTKGKLNTAVLEMKKVNGQHFWAGMFVTLNAEKTYAQTVVVDITRQIHFQEELEAKVIERTRELTESLGREKELNEMKSHFVSMASHEFRTPLSTILSSSSLLEMYTESDQQEKRMVHINRINAAVKNLTDLLTNFLTLERLAKGFVEAENSLFNLPDFLETIVGDLEGMTIKKNQRISYTHSGGKMVEQSKTILKNVFLNLLSNASKYSAEGNEIELKSIVTGDHIKVIIKDYGIGVPLEDQKKLFTEFFRAGNAGEIPGTGLGLSIVKKYIDLLNGKISFESTPGKGTEFTIVLPSGK
ncbi:MAG: domain S-box-containing protein [Ferruginibacter sp.]|uniref:sensor histidine kinase n=1 Tax=Ferruginibacter sp. TaxID=1940288 RepID=UPI0026589D61|nr:PAS domain S-box protein [Ferruginibacter sp.]MDB5276538.1 domain S-box-containing protein [Ferruginibacter sp.]